MKFLIACALLPMAMCLPALLDEDQLKADVMFLGKMFAKSDLTKQACEAECAKYITSDKELNTVVGCPLVCGVIQEELEKLVSEHDDPKRTIHFPHLPHLNITSLFDLETLKKDLQLIIDTIGSNASEQVCETGCHHALSQGHVLNFGCPFLCRSFQTLIQTFHIHKDTPRELREIEAGVEDKLKADILFLGKMFAKSELTKKACEAECEKYITSDQELNKVVGCPLVCGVIQEELEKLVSGPDNSKRGLLGHLHFPHLNFSSLFDLETLKQDLQLLVDMVGSDPMEQNCEGACHRMIKQGHVLNYGCPFVCHSFQTLVQSFHIHRDPVAPLGR